MAATYTISTIEATNTGHDLIPESTSGLWDLDSVASMLAAELNISETMGRLGLLRAIDRNPNEGTWVFKISPTKVFLITKHGR